MGGRKEAGRDGGREGGREGWRKGGGRERRRVFLVTLSCSKRGIAHFMSSSSSFEFELNFELYFVPNNTC